MPWDAQDRTRYEDEVLVAARARGLPADLFTRYGIGPRLERRLRADPAAFTEHVAEVCAYWRALQDRRRSLKKVLADLIADHERMEDEGALTHAHFHRVRCETARRALAEWSEIAGNLTTTLLDRDALRSMIAPVGVAEADAERVLLDHGVRVVDRLPELPDAPPVRAFRALRENLRVRGVAFSPMVVFGEQRLAHGFTVLDGFRLCDGAALDKVALDEAAQHVRLEAATDSRTAAENVLEILRAEDDSALRESLVLWEIVSDLRERPESLTESGLVRHWVHRGLVEEEAMLLAAAVRHSGPRTDPVVRAERDVRDLLVDNQLRQAQEAAADLPEEHDLHARLRVRVRQVEELTGEADRALRAGDREEAARALAAAVDVAADDEVLTARLGEVEPLPPRGVEARVDGRSVVVTWQPSPSLAGTVTYRVTRRTGRDGSAREVPVGELSGTEITDTGAPVGSEARYTVVAVRGGRGVSEAVSTPPVMIAPEVSSLRVCAGEREVSGSWEAPAEAVRVEVLRGEGAPPRGAGDGVRVETDGTGFRDTGVRTDVEYHYRIRAIYVTSNGHARGSAGLVRRASPGPCPDPVRDLSVRPDGGTDFVASWTDPPRGRVVLRVGAEPPEWPPGTVVGPDDLDSYGREVDQRPVTENAEGTAGAAGVPDTARTPHTARRPDAADAVEAAAADDGPEDAGPGAPGRGPAPGPATPGTGFARTEGPAPVTREEREGVRVLGPADKAEVAVRNSQVHAAGAPGPRPEGPAPSTPEPAASGEKEGVRILGPAETTGDGDGGHAAAPAPAAGEHQDAGAAAPVTAGEEAAWEGVRVLGPDEGAGTGAHGGGHHAMSPPEPTAPTAEEGAPETGFSEGMSFGAWADRVREAGVHAAHADGAAHLPGPRRSDPEEDGAGFGLQDDQTRDAVLPGTRAADQGRLPYLGHPASTEYGNQGDVQVLDPAEGPPDGSGTGTGNGGAHPPHADPAPASGGEREGVRVLGPAETTGAGARTDADHAAHLPPRSADHGATGPGATDAGRRGTGPAGHAPAAAGDGDRPRADGPAGDGRPRQADADDDRALAALTLGSGTHHVLAVTVAGDQSVVGTSVRVTAAPPVRDLHAERFDTSVRLGWTWPDDAAAAVVSWRPETPGAEPWIGGELRCTRLQYACDGGFEAPMSPDSVRVDVRAVVPFEDGEAVSAPTGVTVPGRAVLDYRVEAAGLLRRDRLVHVFAEEDCDMPEVSVVYAEGPVQPHSAAQGLVLAVFPAQHLAAGEWVSVRVRPPRGTGEGWLMCFPSDEDDREVRLRQPPVRELRW